MYTAVSKSVPNDGRQGEKRGLIPTGCSLIAHAHAYARAHTCLDLFASCALRKWPTGTPRQISRCTPPCNSVPKGTLFNNRCITDLCYQAIPSGYFRLCSSKSGCAEGCVPVYSPSVPFGGHIRTCARDKRKSLDIPFGPRARVARGTRVREICEISVNLIARIYTRSQCIASFVIFLILLLFTLFLFTNSCLAALDVASNYICLFKSC